MLKFKCAMLAGVFYVSSAWGYTISMTEPSADRAYHRPAQTIEVVASVSPRLPAGYTTAILLNGKVVADGLTASLPTHTLDPNSYQLSAIIMDKNAKTVAKDERTVYVIQKSRLAHAKQNAIKERESYDDLSWHKKAWIGIHPKKQAPQKVNEQTPTWLIE